MFKARTYQMAYPIESFVKFKLLHIIVAIPVLHLCLLLSSNLIVLNLEVFKVTQQYCKFSQKRRFHVIFKSYLFTLEELVLSEQSGFKAKIGTRIVTITYSCDFGFRKDIDKQIALDSYTRVHKGPPKYWRRPFE